MKDISLKYCKIELIEQDCNLAELFNHVLKHLRQARMAAAPIDFEEEEETKSEQIVLFYESCLWELYLHGVINRLITWREAVSKYLGEYGGSWRYYASSKRLDSIRKDGGEPEDFDENGEIRIDGISDEELEGYTLKYDLYTSIRNAAISAYPRHLEGLFYMLIGCSRVDEIEMINRTFGKKLKHYKEDEEGNMEEMTFAEIVQQKALKQTSMEDLVKMVVAVAFEFRSLVRFITKLPTCMDLKDELIEFNMKVVNLMNLNFKMSGKAEEFYLRIIATVDNMDNIL